MALLIAETTYVSKHRAALIIAEKKGALNASYIAALIDADLADQQLADVNGWWATGAARLARGSFIMLRATPVFNCPSPVAEDSECFHTTSSGNSEDAFAHSSHLRTTLPATTKADISFHSFLFPSLSIEHIK